MTSFDRFKNSYECQLDEALRFSGQDADFFTRAKARGLHDLARRYVGNPAQLEALDIGCAVGLTDTFLLPTFKHVTGVDISAPLIERAAERNPEATYHSYEGGRLPYDDNSFDVVFTFCVLHHVPPRERPTFVAEMHRVTRHGGIAVVGEHNPLNPLTQLVVSRCAFDEDAVLLRAREVDRLFRQAKLDPVEKRYILILPSEAPTVQRLERALRAVPIGAQYLLAGRPI